MGNILFVIDALDYIEANLTQNFKTEEMAKSLYCSKSYLEKLFRLVTGMSIKDYSLRRRMSCAARELMQCQEMSILDLAIKYGYSSNETFQYQKTEIPLALYVVSYKIEERTIKYSELFAAMQRKLDDVKDF